MANLISFLALGLEPSSALMFQLAQFLLSVKFEVNTLINQSFVIRYWLKYLFQKFKLSWTTLIINKKLLWKCHWMINEWSQQICPSYDRFPNPSGRLTTILVPVLKFSLETKIPPTQIIVRDRIKWGIIISGQFCSRRRIINRIPILRVHLLEFKGSRSGLWCLESRPWTPKIGNK